MTPLLARRAAVLSLLALSLSGCAGLEQLSRVATPTDLYTLSPKNTFDEALPRVDSQIVVEEPTAAASVDTDRIAVKPSPLRVQYFPGARWWSSAC